MTGPEERMSSIPNTTTRMKPLDKQTEHAESKTTLNEIRVDGMKEFADFDIPITGRIHDNSFEEELKKSLIIEQPNNSSSAISTRTVPSIETFINGNNKEFRFTEDPYSLMVNNHSTDYYTMMLQDSCMQLESLMESPKIVHYSDVEEEKGKESLPFKFGDDSIQRALDALTSGKVIQPPTKKRRGRKRKGKESLDTTEIGSNCFTLNPNANVNSMLLEQEIDRALDYFGGEKDGRKEFNFKMIQPDKKVKSVISTVKPENIFKSSLNEVPSDEENNNNMTMQIRKKRFDGDLYSPGWIRGKGSNREGMCPICTPPLWLKIKQSAYWYHLNFYHGISASTGRPYNRPTSYRRVNRSKELLHGAWIEGFCEFCQDWLGIVETDEAVNILDTGRLQRTLDHASWFKHAQKCHNRKVSLPANFLDQLSESK